MWRVSEQRLLAARWFSGLLVWSKGQKTTLEGGLKAKKKYLDGLVTSVHCLNYCWIVLDFVKYDPLFISHRYFLCLNCLVIFFVMQRQNNGLQACHRKKSILISENT